MLLSCFYGNNLFALHVTRTTAYWDEEGHPMYPGFRNCQGNGYDLIVFRDFIDECKFHLANIS